MSSWLSRSLGTSLRLDGDGGYDDSHSHGGGYDDGHSHGGDSRPECPSSPPKQCEEDDESDDHGRDGVRDDLSELKHTLTRHLWDVASFLAPPPSHPSTPTRSGPDASSAAFDPSEFPGEDSDDNATGISGIRGEISEMGARFRTGVSAVSEMVPHSFPLGHEEDDRGSVDQVQEWQEEEEEDFGGVVGVTEEVLTFATNISMHPETWLDFPLEEEQDMEDFDMSDAQRKHALVVEQLLPRLAALRIELCPGHMTVCYFWKVYFVLLHPRLNKLDAELLSTPQVVAARARWMQELQKRTKAEEEKDNWRRRVTSHSYDFSNTSHEDLVISSPYSPCSEKMHCRTFSFDSTDVETDNYPAARTEMEITEESVIEEKPLILSRDKDSTLGPSFQVIPEAYEDDEDDWLRDDNSDLGSYSGNIIPIDGDDVTFSDLEEEDDLIAPVKS